MADMPTPRVMKFASLQKLVKFDNSDPNMDGWTFSVTVAGPSKVRLNINNRNTKVNLGFNFYLITFIPWLEGVIKDLDTSTKDYVEEQGLSGTIPEQYRTPDKPSSATFVISEDDEGPFIQLKFDNKSPKFRFKSIPGNSYSKGPDIIDPPAKAMLRSYLRMTIDTVTLVSDYIAAIEANSWSPPVEAEAIEDRSNTKPDFKESKDSDIPF